MVVMAALARKLHRVDCGSRTIEYQVFGRCAAEDPIVICLPGMWKWRLARHLSACCEAYGLPRGPFPQSAACLFTRLARKDGSDPRAAFDAVPLTFVCLARAGYDGSTMDRKPWNMHYEDGVADVAAIADHIGARTFAVYGWSSGGPCALAVAHALPDRISAVCVLCGDSSYAPGFPAVPGFKLGATEEDSGIRRPTAERRLLGSARDVEDAMDCTGVLLQNIYTRMAR